jgi:subtilisin family serine protease
MSDASARAKAKGGWGITRYALFFLVLTLLVALTLVVVPAAGGEPAGPSVADRYIVMFNEGVSPAAAAADIARQHAVKVSHVYSSALKGFAGSMPEGRLLALQKDPRIKSIEPDLVMRIAEQTTPTGVDRIEADLNATARIDGTDERVNVTVAVIDTGIDLDHPDLNVDVNLSGGFDSRDPGDANDENGHGTHVAGTIGALDNDYGVVGVAPGVKLVAVRVLGADGSGYLSDIIKGIDYVTANAGSIAVANMSLGGTGVSSAYRTAFQNSVAAGVVYTVAAGNSGKDIYGRDGNFGTRDDFIPAAYPEVATISAMADSDGEPGGSGATTSYGADDSFASFSNYSRYVVSGNPVSSPGAAIDLILPGVSILSTYKNGGYATMSGTSMASPHAAGLAALYIAERGKPVDAAGVTAVRQALIHQGKAMYDAAYGLTTQNDKDANHENVGWAVASGTPPPPIDAAPTVAWVSPKDGATLAGTVQLQIAASDTETDPGGLTVVWTLDEGGPGETSYNSSSGAYEASWDTNSASEGDHTLTATATDTANNTTTESITVTVRNATEPPPSSESMYVAAITWQKTGPHLKAIVTIRTTSTDAPLAGASVSFAMRYDNDGDGYDDGERTWANVLTNSSGQAEFQWKSAPKGGYLGEVTALVYSNYTWVQSVGDWSTYPLR